VGRNGRRLNRIGEKKYDISKKSNVNMKTDTNVAESAIAAGLKRAASSERRTLAE
jgi:hypothetical protein